MQEAQLQACHTSTQTHNKVISIQPYLLRSALNKNCKIYANVNVTLSDKTNNGKQKHMWLSSHFSLFSLSWQTFTSLCTWRDWCRTINSDMQYGGERWERDRRVISHRPKQDDKSTRCSRTTVKEITEMMSNQTTWYHFLVLKHITQWVHGKFFSVDF